MRFSAMVPRFTVVLSAVLAHASPLAAELLPVDIKTDQLSAVAQVNNSAYGRCTGVLIAPDRLLTAAHCLFNGRTGKFIQPESIHIVLGYDRGKYGFKTVASEVTIGDGYDPSGTSPSSADYAVLYLSSSAPGNFRPLQVAEANTSSSFITPGFARKRPEMISASPKCRIKARAGENLIVTNCQVEHGMSGGPLIDTESWSLVGIQIASGNNNGQAVSVAIDAKSLVLLLSGARP